MKKQNVIAFPGKPEIFSSEHELLKEALDAIHVSPERIEETIAQAKAQSQQ